MTRGILIGAAAAALAIAAVGAGWWARGHSELIPSLIPARAPATIEDHADAPPDDDLQALVDEWRAEDAGSPSAWQMAEVDRVKQALAREERKLESLRLSHERAVERAQTLDGGAARAARWDASLIADQAPAVQAEIARLKQRLEAMERRVGLRP